MLSNVNIPVVLYAILMIVLALYAVLKEKEASGCKDQVSLKQFCDDFKSDWVKDSVPSVDDTVPDILNKLQASSRAYEKVAIWRRCLIISTAIMLAIVAFAFPLFKSKHDWCFLIPIHLMIFLGMYFNYNHQNFHVNNRIKTNVDTLIERAKILLRL